MNPHFLQSAAWQSFQEALGRKVYRQKGIDWEFMAILEPGTRLSPSRLYCPYGPTVSSIKGLKSALKALTKLATSFVFLLKSSEAMLLSKQWSILNFSFFVMSSESILFLSQ